MIDLESKHLLVHVYACYSVLVSSFLQYCNERIFGVQSCLIDT